MIDALLQTLEFTPKQIAVFNAVCDLSRCNANSVAKACNFPRTSVYSILEELLELGVIHRHGQKKSTFYTPAEPKAFKKLINRREERLAKQREAAIELETQLEASIGAKHQAIPKVRVFEGRKQIEEMLYSDLPKWRASYLEAGDSTLWGYQDHTFVEHYHSWHHHAWKTRGEGERIKLLSTQRGVKQQQEATVANRQIRQVPISANFASSIWVRGNFVILAMTRETPHFAVVIAETTLAQNMRALFQTLWELSEKKLD